jgi:phospholipid/cholesterol/gamma-HCH transport system substrate-binding protein
VQTNHWKLGLFVVTGIGLGIAAVFWLGFRRLNRESSSMVTYFDESVQGLDVGSPVKFRGVTLGTVATITVAPDHRHVEVWMKIYTEEVRRLGFEMFGHTEGKDVPLFRPQLAAAGITGVKFVQFDAFDPVRYPAPVLPFEVPQHYYTPSVPSTLKSLEEVANEIFDRLPKLSDEIGDAVVEARKSFHTLSDLAGWVKSDDSGIKRAIASLQKAADGLARDIHEAELAQTTKSVRGAAASVGDTAGRFGDQSEDLAATLASVREALEALRALAARLDRDPSALLRGRAVEGGR